MANQRALNQQALAKFEKNEEKLLRRLIDGRKQAAAGDAEALLTALRRFAESYLLYAQMRLSATSNARTIKDLTQLKQKLSDSYALLKKNDVAAELRKAVFGARYTKPTVILMADLRKVLNEVTKFGSHVREFAMTASTAATKARRKPGRPSGSTILPSYYIVGLAKLYRDATGHVPGAGEGPFGLFLVEFLNAVGANLERRSVFNLIISERKKSLAADANSPFKRNSTH
jgi:hypothetical protein